jgi:phosphoglycolate phosphatase
VAHLLLRGERLRHLQSLRPAPVEAILFDKDGTLSHSEPLLASLARARLLHCLRLSGLAGDPSGRQLQLADLLQRAYGLHPDGVDPAGALAVAPREHNLISTATALAQTGLGWPEAQAIAEEAFARAEAPAHTPASHPSPLPTAGLIALLERLRPAGVRCAVISNDEETGIHGFLERHGIASHFAAVRSAGQRPRKPDPAAVHDLCAELGVRPGRSALIGDANSDLHMARQAGVAVVLGYGAGWLRPPALDPSFPQLGHWDELGVEAASGIEAGKQS